MPTRISFHCIHHQPVFIFCIQEKLITFLKCEIMRSAFISRCRYIPKYWIRSPGGGGTSTQHGWFRSGTNAVLDVQPCNQQTHACHAVPCRSFSSKPQNSKKSTNEKEDEAASSSVSYSETNDPADPAYFRHAGILFHDKAISSHLFPDNSVIKRPLNDGDPIDPNRRLPVEFEYGSFWMIKEMRVTDDKPVRTNPDLIPQTLAQHLPPLTVTSLANDGNEETVLPDHLIQKNRSNDPAAQCTVLALSCRQYGFSLIPSWIDPIRERYGNNSRVQTIVLNVSEGGFLLRTLSPLLKWMVRINTSEAERPYTYMHYGNEAAFKDFQIHLGCHNVMTCFVYLLDGLGNVRWAASGAAEPEELQDLLDKHIPQLLPKTKLK